METTPNLRVHVQCTSARAPVASTYTYRVQYVGFYGAIAWGLFSGVMDTFFTLRGIFTK
jgi:hypothetical protein